MALPTVTLLDPRAASFDRDMIAAGGLLGSYYTNQAWNETPEKLKELAIKGATPDEGYIERTLVTRSPAGAITGMSNYCAQEGEITDRTSRGNSVKYKGWAAEIYTALSPDTVNDAGMRQSTLSALGSERFKATVEAMALKPGERVRTIVELGNPLLMTPAQYLAETQAQGQTPIEQIAQAEAAGLRQQRFRYIEPDLEHGHGAARDLAIFTADLTTDGVIPVEQTSKKTVREIIGGYTEKSFPRRVDLEKNPMLQESPELAPMAQSLAGKGNIQSYPRGSYQALEMALGQGELERLAASGDTRPLGEIFPTIAQQIMGRQELIEHADILPTGASRARSVSEATYTAMQTGDTTVSESDRTRMRDRLRGAVEAVINLVHPSRRDEGGPSGGNAAVQGQPRERHTGGHGGESL